MKILVLANEQVRVSQKLVRLLSEQRQEVRKVSATRTICLSSAGKRYRNFQIERGRALANATAGVVVRTVARTVVAVVVAGLGGRHTTQVRAHTDGHKPLVLAVLDTLFVALRVTETGDRNVASLDAKMPGQWQTDAQKLDKNPNANTN